MNWMENNTNMNCEKRVFNRNGDVVFVLLTRTTTVNEVDRDCALPHKPPHQEPQASHIHMQVSSRRMILASPYFRGLLAGAFMETEILTLTGHVEIELPEEDPVVFTILLNIIHGRDRRVPRRIQPKLLVMLAMAVDKYQLGEAVRIHSHVWMDEMMRHIPDYYDHDSHDLLYWISISWIFRHAKAFDKAAKVLIHRATGPLNRELFEDMPMPQWVIDNIELDRICLLETLFDELAFWVENFQTWAQSCQHYSHGIWDSCEKVVLHSYRSSCRARKIFPVPDAPYTGHSVGSLLEDVRTLQVKTLCSRITPSGMQGDTGGHGFIDEVYDGCTWIVETAEILEMKDLENPKKYSRLTAIDYDFQELEISGSDSKGTC